MQDGKDCDVDTKLAYDDFGGSKTDEELLTLAHGSIVDLLRSNTAERQDKNLLPMETHHVAVKNTYVFRSSKFPNDSLKSWHWYLLPQSSSEILALCCPRGATRHYHSDFHTPFHRRKNRR
jgi:hypothetical protein